MPLPDLSIVSGEVVSPLAALLLRANCHSLGFFCWPFCAKPCGRFGHLSREASGVRRACAAPCTHLVIAETLALRVSCSRVWTHGMVRKRQQAGRTPDASHRRVAGGSPPSQPATERMDVLFFAPFDFEGALAVELVFVLQPFVGGFRNQDAAGLAQRLPNGRRGSRYRPRGRN